MNPIPQTLGDEVTAGINQLIHDSDRFRDWNSVEVRAVFARIKELEEADPVDAAVRFGALAAICGKVDALSDYYQMALAANADAPVKHEFWVSMSNAGLYEECQEIGSWLLEPKRGFIGQIWGLAASMGQILAVQKNLVGAKKLYPKLKDVDFSAVERAAQVMHARGLRDEEVVSVLSLMGQIQRAHQIMYWGTRVSQFKVLQSPEDPAYLYFSVPINANNAEVHAMNRDLARLLVTKMPTGAFPSGMVAAFVKAPVELRAAA